MEYILSHIGINTSGTQEAQRIAKLLTDVFQLPLRQGHGYIFVNEVIEIREQHFYGEKGHLAFVVESIDHALEELKEKNVYPIEESAVRNSEGRIISIFLNLQIAGFAIHLVEKK